MKKNNITLYIIFSIVVIVSIFLFFSNQKGTIKKELRDFAYEDTASINKIFLADKNNNTILLERINANTWIVNKKYTARRDAINLLLDCIASVRIKSPVPKASLSTVTKHLATRAVKVEIYANNKRVKTYYVGPPTPDNLGTYMILENSTVPFITHKPGFNGYLSIRYFVNEIEWRDVRVFPVRINNFYSLNVYYPSHSDDSYTIIRKSPGVYKLLNNSNDEIPVFDTLLVKENVMLTLKANVDRWEPNVPKTRYDSLIKSIPLCQITVKTIKGESYKLNLYKRPNLKSYVDSLGNVMSFDPDVMYGIINDSSIALCQYFTFDPIMIKINNLLQSEKHLATK